MSFDEFFSTGLIPKFIADNNIGTNGFIYVLMMILTVVCSTVVPYLLGSINFSIIISKKQYNEDIRDYGSGNAGMTYMMRTYGSKAAALTLVGDALKAIISGFIGYAVFGQFGAYVAGLFCVIGHMFPVFYKFRGGKGVVTAAASILVCNPFVFLICLVIFVIIVLFTRYISLGSVMCVLLYPVILNRIDKLFFEVEAMGYHLIAIIMALLIVYKHKENIKRLINGTESKFSFKKSKKSEDTKDTK